jgi:HK97 family phage major capsid protein
MGDGAISLDNRSLLAKADLALSDLVSSGGLLQPYQAQKFIRILIDDSKLMRLATVIPMRAPKQVIDKIKFGSRILRPGQEATALPAADRAKPSFSGVALDAKLFKAEVNLTNEVLEDSIEREELRQTIMQLMGERISLDIEELLVLGDTSSTDPYLAQFNGVLKQATSNVVNANGQTANKTIWRDMLKTLPSEYMRNKDQMIIMTSGDAYIDYHDSVSDRATPVGDRALESATDLRYSGVRIIDVPKFPENLGPGNYTNAILTDPKNLCVGVWREIRFETDKDIRRGVVIIVATMRMDFTFMEENAVVKATNIAVS